MHSGCRQWLQLPTQTAPLCVQHTNTPFSFVSTTQVRVDAHSPTVNSVCTFYFKRIGAHLTKHRCKWYNQHADYITNPRIVTPTPVGNVVRKIIRQTNARRRLPARSARVGSTKQCSAQWTLYQTRYAHSVTNQGIQLNAAEFARKLKRRLEPKNQELLEAMCQIH